jgi:hypothetical protein
MKVWKRPIVLMQVLLAVSLFVPVPAHAQGRDLLDEAQACLRCHEKQGIIKKFQNNESIDVYVDAEQIGRASCRERVSSQV